MSDAVRDILGALQSEIDAPVRGDLIARILEAIDFATVASAFIPKAAEKLELTRADGKIHDFMLLLPSESMVVGVRCFIHPGTLEEGAAVAQDDLYGAAGQFLPADSVAGVLDMAIFAGSDPLNLRFAWLPLPDRTFDDPVLASPVIPWRTQAAPETTAAPLTGSDLIDLAKATDQLTRAMRRLMAIWPEEGGPVDREKLPEGREVLRDAIAVFNAAAGRCRLAHGMPVSMFDATWRPHNLRNALEFQSVPATLRAELHRTWSAEAAQAFRDALDILTRGEAESPRLAEIRSLGGPVLQDTVQPAAPPAHLDVFLCYTWADKTRGARDVYEFVVRQGATAWLDEEQRLPDAAVDAHIARALETASAVVVCLSREMMTRGGYALRELLFVLSASPEHCILARLDKTPVPETLRGLRAIDWFTRDGPEQLRVQLAARGDRPALREPRSLARPSGPLIEALLQLVRGPAVQPRLFASPERGAQLALRAELLCTVLDFLERYEADDWSGIRQRAQELQRLDRWPALTGALVRTEPTLIGLAVRLRASLLHAEVQLVNTGDWNAHNRAAYALVEELLEIDPAMFSPAPEAGWLAGDCRVAVRDCLDSFAIAEEWLRGWSPDMLADTPGIPGERVMTIQDRMALRSAVLGERMLALRALEDLTAPDIDVASWSDMWSSLREVILDKMRVAGHPLTTVYFAELRSIVADEMVARVAVALADGLIEAFRTGGRFREERIEEHGEIRVRFVLRSYRAVPSKFTSFALAHGTVLDDLTNHPHVTDLTMLISAFVVPGSGGGPSTFEVTFNVMPHPRPDATSRLGRLGPFLMPQMLSAEEQEQSRTLLKGTIVYEEV